MRSKISESFGNWQILATFQSNIAKRWLDRGNQSTDLFARFFFYFSGFNALYFLWGKVDDIRNQKGDPAGEEKQIDNLLRKFTPSATEQILNEVIRSVEFFQKRRPIQRMNRRTREFPFDGDESEGRKWCKRLTLAESPIERLVALGSILYLVRSNLVHGSKVEIGDDKKVIEFSEPVLKRILEESLSVTRKKFLSKIQ